MILSVVTSKRLDALTLDALNYVSNIYEAAGFYDMTETEPRTLGIGKYDVLYIPDGPNFHFDVDRKGLHLYLTGNDGERTEFHGRFAETIIRNYGIYAVEEARRFRAGEDTIFNSYAEHNVEHLEATIEASEKMMEIRELEKWEKDVVRTSLMCHDLGMANVVDYEYGKRTGVFETGQDVRSHHCLTSAFEAMRMKDDITRDTGMNERELYLTALVIASHSKSNSGLLRFEEPYYKRFLDNIDETCVKASRFLEIDNPFDRDKAQEYMNDPQFEAEFKKLSEVVSLSDAFSHSALTYDRRTNQCGDTLVCRMDDFADFCLHNKEDRPLDSNDLLTFINYDLITTTNDGKPYEVPVNFTPTEKIFLLSEKYFGMTEREPGIYDVRVSPDGYIDAPDKIAPDLLRFYVQERSAEMLRYQDDVTIVIHMSEANDMTPEDFAKDFFSTKGFEASKSMYAWNKEMSSPRKGGFKNMHERVKLVFVKD